MSGISSSPVWDHFVKIPNMTVAKCILCKKKYSYKTSITNLKKHLNYKHKSALSNIKSARSGASAIHGEGDSSLQSEPLYPEELQTGGTDSDEHDDNSNSSIKFSAEIWGRFEQEGSMVNCTLCQKSIDNSIEDMKSHLEEEHPRILISILHSKSSEAMETQEAEETYTEVVYLEDEKRKSKPFKHAKVKKDSRLKYKEFSNSEHPETDAFLSYVEVMLRKVPQGCMPKLQLDIISLILNAQMSVSGENSFNRDNPAS